MKHKKHTTINRKAQVTLFMIIGTLMLAGAALTFFAVQIQTKQQLENKAEEVTQQLLKTTALEEYLTLCLNDAAEKGTYLLGMQGGVIYKSQNGTTTDYYGKGLPPGLLAIPKTIQTTGYAGTLDQEVYVSYGLREPSLSQTSTKHPAPPAYPYLGYLIPQKQEHKTGNYFGTITQKSLCDPKGPNRPGAVLYRSCETYGPPKTIQEELAQYIINGIEQCIQIEEFSHIIGYNITKGELASTVTLTENSIIFDLIYPITLNIKGREITKPIEIKTELNIRLKNIHEYIHNYLKESSNNLFFNMTSGYENITIGARSYWLPGFTYTIEKNACPTCPESIGGAYDTIISVSDEQSRLKGQPYTYQTAIKNRIPALEWVHMPNALSDQYDIIVVENSSFEIKPQGYDPDQDKLYYTYTGWKASYSEKHTFTGKELANTEKSEISENILQNTLNYIKTLKDTLVETSHEDIGPHNITLNLTDEAGNSDYQIIRVLVNDIPIIDFKTDNMFEDISNEFASTEDPYKLDASGTTAIYDNGFLYTFIDERENFRQTSSESIVYLPEENPNIQNIKNQIFKETGEHTITMTASDNFYEAKGTGTAEKKIEVKQCLPHKNPETAPWPFNNLEERNDNYENIENPYQADHTCCTTNYEPAEQTKPCYTGELYGCRTDFDNNKIADIEDYRPTKNYGQQGDNNDVYKAAYTSYCDGERGNTCTGEQKLFITKTATCDNKCQTCKLGEQGCVDLPATTQCGQQQCSTGDGATFPTTGPKLCNGYCEQGACTTAGDCECDTTTCRAQCESGQINREETPTTITCSNCNTDKCEWNEISECQKYKICTDRTGTNCQTTKEHDPTKTEYCFYNPTCTPTGCRYQQTQMTANTCGECTTTRYKTGGQCPTATMNQQGFCQTGCKYEPQSARCIYTTQQYCPTTCITQTIAKPTTPDSCITTTRETWIGTLIAKNEYCHHGGQCTAQGCQLTTTTLDPNRCDTCINGQYTQGEQCKLSQKCSDNCQDYTRFYYKTSPNSCSGTQCLMESCTIQPGEATTNTCTCGTTECARDCATYVQNVGGTTAGMTAISSCSLTQQGEPVCVCKYKTNTGTITCKSISDATTSCGYFQPSQGCICY